MESKAAPGTEAALNELPRAARHLVTTLRECAVKTVKNPFVEVSPYARLSYDDIVHQLRHVDSNELIAALNHLHAVIPGEMHMEFFCKGTDAGDERTLITFEKDSDGWQRDEMIIAERDLRKFLPMHERIKDALLRAKSNPKKAAGKVAVVTGKAALYGTATVLGIGVVVPIIVFIYVGHEMIASIQAQRHRQNHVYHPRFIRGRTVRL
ncbi:hypothetical protein EMMF5_001203 [Cystobasidiomycetes sp. EMM_F5]